jgi:putative ABC transport system substrate-binding protein
MKRREFMTIVSGVAVFAPLSGFAQETGRKQSGTAKLPGIGILSNAADEHALTPLMAGVFTELQRFGWVNERSAIYEPRFAAGDPSRWPSFVADLVDRKVNVIFAGSHAAAKAAQIGTATIPIVALADDMEEAGLVTSIARTRSNITGVSMFGPELDEKRLELLVEMVPAARRMAALAGSERRPSVARVVANADRLGIELVLIEAPSLDKLNSALDAVATARVDAVNVLASSILYNGRRAIIDRMAASRLPAIYQWPENAAEGALMGYGPTQALIARQLAELIDRILKGVSPAELPVLRPTKFELAINLKTAKALGLTVPPSLIARADEVIE